MAGSLGSAREPLPPGLALALVRELPGDCLSLIAPSGRLSAPSVRINANVVQLLAQQYLSVALPIAQVMVGVSARQIVAG
jgi:hypothetical protein